MVLRCQFVVLITSFTFFLVNLLPSPFAAERAAFIIGNSAYQATSVLRNPANDARGLAQSLKSQGFSVRVGIDLTKEKFKQELSLFSNDLKGASAAVFFYAGHGLQIEGRNYMVPVDAKLRSEADIPLQLLPLDLVMQQLDRHRITSIVLLDACRDNPIGRELSEGRGLGIVANNRKRLVQRGLARVETGVGTLIAYSTQPGAIALDGDGKHSPFTAALLKHIETPELDIALLMRRVRGDVLKRTNNRQVPWDHSSLTKAFIFAKTPVATIDKSTPSSAPPVDKDTDGDGGEDWQQFAPPSDNVILQGKAPIHDCDRIAASKTDPEKVVPGRLFLEFDGEAGVKACRAALQTYPNTTRFQFQLARSLHRTKAYKEAEKLYKPLVARGYRTALTNYALQLFEGQGVVRNEAEATRLYRLAAHQGDLFAVYTIAVAYDTGRGVPEDPVLAAHWMYADLLLGHDYALLKMSRDWSAWSVEFRKTLQRLLKNEGVFDGPISGKFGADTIAAMKKIYAREVARSKGQYLDSVPDQYK